MNNLKKTIQIKVASDVVCPWCLVGKKELEIAIDQLKDEYHFDVQFLPFELDPNITEEGVDFKLYITQKFGDWNRFLQNSNMLVERGKNIGLNFDFQNIHRSPNTFDLHRIIQFAHQFGLQSAVKEAYMKAYFENGMDLTIRANVLEVAVNTGLDEELVLQLLNSNEGVNELHMIQDSMRAMGISGVPFFIINDQYGLSGAVPAQQLVQAFKELEMKEN
jgi:predicted DsbA family dithiol-disulfide isomerase